MLLIACAPSLFRAFAVFAMHRFLAAAGLLVALSAAAAPDFRSLLSDWREQAALALRAQARQAPVRTALDDWMRDQRDSLGAVPEGLRAHAAKVKLFATAGFTLDRANEHAATLSAPEFRALVGLSERMLDDCAAFVGSGHGMCRDGNAVLLRVQQALALARREDDDLRAQLARIPALFEAGVAAQRGDVDAYCSGLLRIAALQQFPERFSDGRMDTHARFFTAFRPLDWLQQCVQAGASLRKLERHLARLSDGSARVADALGQPREPALRPWLVLWAQLPADAEDAASLDALLREALLAQLRGDAAAATRAAAGLPAALERFRALDAGRACFALHYDGGNWPDTWAALRAAQPAVAAQLDAACPPR